MITRTWWKRPPGPEEDRCLVVPLAVLSWPRVTLGGLVF